MAKSYVKKGASVNAQTKSGSTLGGAARTILTSPKTSPGPGYKKPSLAPQNDDIFGMANFGNTAMDGEN